MPMSAIRDLRALMRTAAMPILTALVVSYFAYHAVQGQYGMFSLIQLRGQVNQAQTLANNLAFRRAALERRVALLRPDNLDPDMLDEAVRRQLHYAHPDDIIILQN